MEKTNDRLAGTSYEPSAAGPVPVQVKNRPSRLSKMADMIRMWGYASRGGYGEKTVTDKSCADVLQDLSLRELKDYCRYLQIPSKKSWNKKKSAEAIYDAFTLHPEYLLYVLEEKEFEELLWFCKKPEGWLRSEPEDFAADKYMALGLMAILMEEEERASKGPIFSYALAQGAEILIGSLEKSDWRAASEKISRDGREILDCMDIYGVMEMDACHEICREVWKLDLEREDFLRLLYWYGRFNGYLRTVEREDGRCYALLSEIDIEETMTFFFQIDEEVGYRKLTSDEMDEMQDRHKSMFLTETCWRPYLDYMKSVVGLKGDDLGAWMDEERLTVMCGATSTDMMESVCGVFTPDAVGSWVELWLAVMEVCADTGLFVLKGHSRRGYGRLTGKEPAHLPIIDREQLKERIGWHTHIYQMSEEIQFKLYETYRASARREAQEWLTDILQDLPEGNLELTYLLVLYQMTRGQYGQAADTVRQVQKAYSQAAADDTLYALLEMIREQGQKGAGNTYRRQSPKIGRNNPCPCGSGKKYKKCCGKED